NLAPDFTHYPGEHTTEIETYERSRHRNDNHNVSASASLAWARRSVGSDGVARTLRNATEERKTKRMKATGARFCRSTSAMISHIRKIRLIRGCSKISA